MFNYMLSIHMGRITPITPPTPKKQKQIMSLSCSVVFLLSMCSTAKCDIIPDGKTEILFSVQQLCTSFNACSITQELFKWNVMSVTS